MIDPIVENHPATSYPMEPLTENVRARKVKTTRDPDAPWYLRVHMIARGIQCFLATTSLIILGYMSSHNLYHAPTGQDLTADGAVLMLVTCVFAALAVMPLVRAAYGLVIKGNKEWLSLELDAMESRKWGWFFWILPVVVDLICCIGNVLALYFVHVDLKGTQCLTSPTFQYHSFHPCQGLLAAWSLLVLAMIPSLVAAVWESYRLHHWSRVVKRAVVTRADGSRFNRNTDRWEV